MYRRKDLRVGLEFVAVGAGTDLFTKKNARGSRKALRATGSH